MKKLIYLIIGIAVLTAYSCNKDKYKVLNLTAINGSESQVVNVKLKSMAKKTFSINCHVSTSTTLNAKDKTFGYMGCDNAYHIISIETGTEIKSIPLPEELNLVEVDVIRNVIIGHYYLNGDSPYNGTDHVVAVNLNDGSIISDKPFYVGGSWFSTYFIRDVENEYVMLKSDNVLVFVNPYSGDIIKTLELDTEADNGVYDRKNNRLIGTAYSNETIYIVAVDLNTGRTLSKVVAQGLNSHVAFEKDYDSETNSYVLVGAGNEVLFFDVATGKVNKKYQLDFDLTSLKLWRSDK